MLCGVFCPASGMKASRQARARQAIAGRTDAEQLIVAEPIERPGLAPVGVELACVRKVGRNEQIGNLVFVASCALEPDHVPDVGERRAPLGEQHGALERLAVGADPRRAVGLLHQAVGGEPRRMLAAAGERPGAAHPIAAVDRDRSPERRARGGHRAGIAEDSPRHLGREKGRRDRAARRLVDAPGGAAIGLGDLLDRLHVHRRLGLAAAARARQQHAEQLP